MEKHRHFAIYHLCFAGIWVNLCLIANCYMLTIKGRVKSKLNIYSSSARRKDISSDIHIRVITSMERKTVCKKLAQKFE